MSKTNVPEYTNFKHAFYCVFLDDEDYLDKPSTRCMTKTRVTTSRVIKERSRSTSSVSFLMCF